jgi:DNA-binding winged helix-turn-helix (wHTH) protein
MPPIRFGVCQLDLEARRLVREGKRVHLSPKAFELLRILVNERPKPVSKERLHERIWPDVFVTDDSLSGLVAEVRAAIGDRGRAAQFLITHQRFGYSFSDVAEPTAVEDNTGFTTFWVAIGERTVVLPAGDSTIGRQTPARVVLDDTCVSRRHARLRVTGSSVMIEDLGSRNGTSVNGERISGPVSLHDGDEITIGTFTLRFREATDLKTTDVPER